MTNDNKKPGPDVPGEKKKLVRRPVEQEAARAASVPAATDAHRATASPRRRQAEAVVDPALDGGASGIDADRLAARYGRRQVEAVVDPRIEDRSAQFMAKSLISVLPPEAVVRLVLFAGRMARKQGKRLPPNIEERLGEAVARGDAAAPTLRDWAIRIGVLDDGPSLTPAGSRDTDPDVHGGYKATDHDRATLRAVELARHLRERLGMSRPTLLAKAELGKRPVSLAAKVSDSGDGSATIANDTGSRS